MSGVVFTVFTVLAGIINYETDKLLYSSAAPMNFIVYTILAAMLPFLVFAVLSYVVIALSSREIKSEDEKRTETQPKQEADLKEETEKEMEPQSSPEETLT